MPDLTIITDNEMNQLALTLLIMLPLVATVAGIARYIVGVKSLGIYAPVTLTFALYVLGITGESTYSDFFTGIQFGVIFISIVLLVSVMVSSLIKKRKFHYFPKISISLSFVAISLFISIVILNMLFGLNFESVNALAILLIASLAEQFTSILFKKKLKVALLLTFETLLTSVISYLLISWSELHDVLLRYPYLILLTLPVNYFVGKYRGLRIREYIRFREVLNQPNTSEK